MVFRTEIACAVIDYDNFAPAEFANRMGVGENIESKKNIQVKNGKKETKIENINKVISLVFNLESFILHLSIYLNFIQ